MASVNINDVPNMSGGISGEDYVLISKGGKQLKKKKADSLFKIQTTQSDGEVNDGFDVGSITYTKCGQIVIVDISITANTDFADTPPTAKLIDYPPYAAVGDTSAALAMYSGYGTGNTDLRVSIVKDYRRDQLLINAMPNGMKKGDMFSGQLVYITDAE